MVRYASATSSIIYRSEVDINEPCTRLIFVVEVYKVLLYAYSYKVTHHAVSSEYSICLSCMLT